MAVSLTGKLAALTALSMMFGGMLLGAQPAASQALAPEGPQPTAEENLEPCQMWQVTVQFEYTHEGSLKKIQCYSHDKGDYIDYTEYMVPPAGFVISPEWDGSLMVDPNSIGLYPNVIPVVPLTYAVDVSYVFSGEEIDRQSFPNLAPGSVIAEPQLEVPAGYLLAEPFAPHEVTGNATLTVELVRAFYDVTITYTDDGDRVGSQAFTGLSLGTVLTASELTIPAGYELAEPFADHTVSGHADLEVPLIKQETSPDGDADADADGSDADAGDADADGRDTDADGAADTDGASDAGGDADADGSPIDEGQTVTDQPKKPTPTPAAARPALANTGAPDTALLVLLGGVLTGLGARALLAHRSRNRRA